MPTITFKVTKEEEDLIREAARKAKTSLSGYIRKRTLPKIPQEKPSLKLKKHPVSGLPYNAGGGVIATQVEIKAALADFP